MIFLLDKTSLAVIILISLRVHGNASTSVAASTTSQDATKLHTLHCNSSESAHMWGDPNANIFYICDEVSNTTRQLHCPLGHGFFNGHGYYGCVPFAKWPACIDSTSSSSSSSSSNIGSSNGTDTERACNNDENLQQTWASMDPNKFYMCQQENAAPLLLNCESGKGYVSAWVAGGVSGKESLHIVGCISWENWRMYMHCDAFY